MGDLLNIPNGETVEFLKDLEEGLEIIKVEK